MFPNAPIVVLAIAGGPACDWERKELRDTFCRMYPRLTLKSLGDVDDSRAGISRVHATPAWKHP